MNMFGTKGQETHDGIIEFKVQGLPLQDAIGLWRGVITEVLWWLEQLHLTSSSVLMCLEWIEMIKNYFWCSSCILPPSEIWSLWFWCYQSWISVWTAYICCIWCVWIIGLVWNTSYLKTRWWLAFEVKIGTKERKVCKAWTKDALVWFELVLEPLFIGQVWELSFWCQPLDASGLSDKISLFTLKCNRLKWVNHG